MRKKIFILAICLISSFMLTSCSNVAELPQFTPVAKGEDIATITTNKGVIKMRFFPEYAPKAVENFTTHAKEGYYDGLIFHRVIKDFMIQTGDPTGTGAGGESIYGEPFDIEVTEQLHHLRGAVGMARTGDTTVSNQSQFYIVQNNQLDPETTKVAEDALNNLDKELPADETGKISTIGDMFPKEILESYLQDGGAPHLDFQYTVFGQVIEGLEVVDAIASVELSDGVPVEDVIIEKVEISTAE